MKSNFHNYVKNIPGQFSSFEYGFSEMLGRSIFAVDGIEWKEHRKIASHLFSGNALKFKMEHVFNKYGDLLHSLFERFSVENKEIDVQGLFQAVIFDAFCEIAFGISFDCTKHSLNGVQPEFLRAFEGVQTACFERFLQPPAVWCFNRIFSLGTERELKELYQILRDNLISIIRKRKIEAENFGDDENGDFLSIYINQGMKNKETQGYLLDDEYLFETVIGMMIAGRDTTSCVNTNLYKYLRTNLEAENKILNELQALTVRSEPMTLETSKSLKYCSAVFNEALRLVPPASEEFRYCLEDDTLPSGLKVKRGMQVYLPILGIARDPRFFANPEKFIPDRWLSQGKVCKIDEFTCPFFWGGPRMCLGQAMARFETNTFMSKIIPYFKIVPLPNHDETFVSGPVSFYKNGLKVRIEKRD